MSSENPSARYPNLKRDVKKKLREKMRSLGYSEEDIKETFRRDKKVIEEAIKTVKNEMKEK